MPYKSGRDDTCTLPDLPPIAGMPEMPADPIAWTQYAGSANPIDTAQKLRDAIDSITDETPMEIRIADDITMTLADADISSTTRLIPIHGDSGGIQKIIKLTSVEGKQCSISANNEVGILDVYGASVYLSNIILKDAASVDPDLDRAGAISAQNALIVMEKDSIIQDCRGYEGGGIYLYRNAAVVMRDNALITRCIVDNKADAYNPQVCMGGGIFVLFQPSRVIMTDDARITDCYAYHYGGGICLTEYPPEPDDLGVILMCRAQINDCSALDEGGGVYVGATEHFLMTDYAQINRCTAGKGGGIYAQGQWHMSASTVTLSGHAQINACKSRYTNSIYEPCKNGGGGLFLWRNADIHIEDSVTFTNNEAAGCGGAIFTDPALNENLNISSGVVFSNNKAYAPNYTLQPDAVQNELDHIHTKSFTKPFMFAHNNYDINIWPIDSTPPPSVSVKARAFACCGVSKDGLFTAVITDDNGDIVSTSASDAGGRFAFTLFTPSQPGEYRYTISQARDADGIRHDKRKIPIVITVYADGDANASYTHGEPFFLNICRA